MQYHVIYPLTEEANGPKGRIILCNDVVKEYFKELKCIVSDETLLSYPDCKITFTLNIDASDK